MQPEKRIARFDADLEIEAYHFQGIMQKFPNHFHEHYVLGFVESGRRRLLCKNKAYTVNQGDLVLFNPLENHTCTQVDDDALDWRSINIGEAVMRRMASEIMGKPCLPAFAVTVVCQSEAVAPLRELHEMIMQSDKGLKKEETCYFLLEQLIATYAAPTPDAHGLVSSEVLGACDYMQGHFAEPLTLDALSHIAGMNKFTLLRSFTIQRGMTPFQYLSTLRVNHAKQLLEAGVSPSEAALRSGFTDQSHFTRFFKQFIGLTPKRYQAIFQNHIIQ